MPEVYGVNREGEILGEKTICIKTRGIERSGCWHMHRDRERAEYFLRFFGARRKT